VIATRRCCGLPPRVTSCDGLSLAHPLGEAIIYASPEQGETDFLTLLDQPLCGPPQQVALSICRGIVTEKPKPIPNLRLFGVNYWVHTGRHRHRVPFGHLVSHICREVAHSLFWKDHCCREAQLTKPSMLETVAATVWDLRMDDPMRPPSFLFLVQEPTGSSQEQNQKSQNLHSPSFKPHSTIPTSHFTKNSTPHPYESTKIPFELTLRHSELVKTSRKFQNWEIPSSSFRALESKPSSKSTKASTPEVQKSELWFFHGGVGIILLITSLPVIKSLHTHTHIPVQQQQQQQHTHTTTTDKKAKNKKNKKDKCVFIVVLVE
jgi:hypothetical protein